MINQLRADLFVLRHSGAAMLSLLVCAVAAALYIWLQHELALGNLGAEAASGVQGLSDVLLVSLLGPLLYGVVVAQPFETKSVHNALLASGRGVVVASTTLVAAAMVTALSLPYGIAALVGRATGAEFAPAIPTAFSLLLTDGEPLTAQGVLSLLAVTLTAGLLMAAKLAVCLPLAFWLKRPLLVMAAGFVWSFVADLLGSTAADVDGLAALVRLTPFSAEQVPTPSSTGPELLGTIAVSAVFIALMGVVSWLILRRSDVT